MKPIQLALTITTTVLALEPGFRAPYTTTCKGNGVSLCNITGKPNTLSYEYRISSASVDASQRKEYVSLRLNGTESLNIPGYPVVPFVPQRFIIPAGMKLDSVSTSIQSTETLSLSYPVEYAEMPVQRGETSQTIPADLYRSDECFPGKISEIATVQNYCGVSIAYVNLYPLQLKGKTKELTSVNSLRIELHLSPKNEPRSGYAAPIFPDRVDPSLLGVENPETLSSYGKSRSTRTGSGTSLIILTNKSFLESTALYSVEDLAERRRSQGISTKIVTVDSIYATTDGIDSPEKIRNFLRKAHAEWGAEYVLIAGDTNIVPVRTLHPQWRQYGTSGKPKTYEDTIELNVPSDFYYQCLDGSYNTPSYSSAFENDGRFWGGPNSGDNNQLVDLLPELSIGRVPAENPREFSNWVTKQFAYEEIGFSDPRNYSVLFAGEYSGFENAMVPDYNIMEDSKACLEEIRIGGGTCQSYTKMGGTYEAYKTASFTSSPKISVDLMYDYDGTWKSRAMIEKLNSNKYGIIQHVGHGFVEEVLRLHRDNLGVLKNSRPFFAYSQACLAGRFTEDCIVERLLTESDQYGLWAGLFNTSFGKAQGYTTDGVAQKLNRRFWDGYFRSDRPIVRLGKLNDESRLALINPNNLISHEKDRYSFYLYGIYSMSLFGDPTAELKIHRPSSSSYLYLTTPAGSTPIIRSAKQDIRWFSTTDEPVTLTLLAKDGTSKVVGTTASTEGSLSWTPSAVVSAGEEYRMILAGSTLADTSAPFDITDLPGLNLVTAPTATVEKGSAIDVSWAGTAATVSLDLVQNGRITPIAVDQPSVGSVSWIIPDSVMSGTQYRVRLTSSLNETVLSDTFAVGAPIIDQFPAKEHFDTLVSGTAVPFGWEQNNRDDFQWFVHSGMTPTKALTNPNAIKTGPSFDHTTGTGNYLYLEATDCNSGDELELLTPRYDLRSYDSATLSFWLHMFAAVDSVMGDFSVELIREGKADSVLFTQNGRFADDRWKQQELALPTGEVVQLRFTGIRRASYASDIALDDIEIRVDGKVVSILEKNQTVQSNSSELVVVPSVLTPDEPIGEIMTVSPVAGSYSWVLFDAVGNVLLRGEGVAKNGLVLDRIDHSRLNGKSGTAVLIVRTIGGDGQKKVYKTTVGLQR